MGSHYNPVTSFEREFAKLQSLALAAKDANKTAAARDELFEVEHEAALKDANHTGAAMGREGNKTVVVATKVVKPKGVLNVPTLEAQGYTDYKPKELKPPKYLNVSD